MVDLFKDYLKNNKIKLLQYLLAFILPIVSMVFIFAAKSIFPFGDRSFLRTDMYHQYAPFFSELQYKLKHFDSLFYTWDLGLGTNFLTIVAYYLSCPLNLLLLIVPDRFVIDFMTYLIAIKMGLCSLNMAIYLDKRFNKKSWLIVPFGMCYGMSGYLAAYSWNIMWLDAILLFPLVILGVEGIVMHSTVNDSSKKYGLLYTITLALTILSNYYIAIMVCMFLVIYFVALNIIYYKKDNKALLRRTVNFSVYSICAALIAGVLLVPVIYAFKTTASSATSFPKKWTEYFAIIDMLARHLPFVDIENGLDHWPNIFCGTSAIMLLLLYFSNKKYSTKEKVVYGCILFFLLASFALNKFNFIMHGLHFPNSLPARHSFIYVFLVIMLSYKAISKCREYTTKHISFTFAITLFLFLLFNGVVGDDGIHFYSTYIGILFLLVYYGFIYIYKIKPKYKSLIILTVITFVFFELILNMAVTSVTTTSRTTYLNDRKDVIKLHDEIKQQENSFYRIEKMKRKTKDDGAFLHFPSASIFSSSAYESGSKFYKKIGCEAATNAYSITGSTPLVNALFSLKYALYTKEAPNPEVMNLKLLNSSNETYLYENINTLPLSFVLDKEKITSFETVSANPATIQNNFSKTFGGEESILKKQDITEDGIKVSFTTKKAGDYYVFVRDLSIKEISAELPSGSKTYKNLDRGFFVELGYLDENKTIVLKNKDKEAKDLKCEVFYFNFPTLTRLVETIKNDSNFELIEWKSTKLKYKLNSNIKGTALLTVPYDNGWTVFLDGEKVDFTTLWNFFISFDVEQGEHIVEMKYMPSGFWIGLFLSILGFALFFVYYHFSHIIWKRGYKPKHLSSDRLS